ncbi:hypothetical protein F183_A32760 [Bryobacterales bacterium F-183]|nr:hypothetical protein F183_A32760 [Bryobacterales bacterium F-183]
MPYCVNCGNQVLADARFCANCGAPQAVPASGPVPPRTRGPLDVSDMDPRMAATLCYVPIFGWLASLFVLASSRFRTDTLTRFHAFQGLYLFVAWLVIQWVFGPIGRQTYWAIGFNPVKLAQLALFGVWIFMLIKTWNRELFKLPLIGEWADRSVSEQR